MDTVYRFSLRGDPQRWSCFIRIVSLSIVINLQIVSITVDEKVSA